MTWLLADSDAADTIAAGLRSALEAKTQAMTSAWDALESERKALEQAGVDLGSPEAAVKLDDLYNVYAQAAGEERDLSSRYQRRLEGGKSISIPQAKAGRLDGLGAEFLRRMGAGVVGLKALDGTTGGTAVPSFFDARIRELPLRQLFIRTLIPVVRASTGDRVDFVRQSAFTNSAAPVAAGGLKPTSVLTVERVTESVRVIAHVSEALDRSILADFDALTDFIAARSGSASSLRRSSRFSVARARRRTCAGS